MTTRGECVRALQDTAEQLGKSPTKAEYETLEMTPSASTIMRVVGGWNEAKEAAGLETEPSTGSRVVAKPDGVDIPDGTDWDKMTQDQRWHYRHVKHNTERTRKRRQRLRAWVSERKAETGCTVCSETDPRCLDFHHVSDEKEMAVTDMVTSGYSKDRLADEMADCEVLCGNCHRKRHDRRPAVVRETDRQATTKRERLQKWTFELRQKRGCQRCSEEDPVCLQFHHPNPKSKTASVGELISDSAPETEIREEVAKCIVLCANCHRKEHVEPPDAADVRT